MTVGNSIRTIRNRVDILIVGAGPAGLSAAETLAQGGARVAVIDRASRPGGKACAGGLTREAAAALRPTLFETVRCCRFGALNVISPRGEIALAAEDRAPLLVTIDRVEVQRTWAAMLRDAGVRFSLDTRFQGICDGQVLTDGGVWSAGHVIGADGAQSRVRRGLGLPRGLRIAALQLRIDRQTAARAGIETASPTVWFDAALLGSGYTWAFPYGEELRVGIGLSAAERAGPGLRERFAAWLARVGLSMDDSRLEAGTIACDYQGYRFGRVFLAGDAAGFASPLTGEGIGQALISGREVAQEILSPGYRSHPIAALATRHRRTFDALAFPLLTRLLDLAPCLLRLGALRRQTLRRFVL